MNKSDISAKQVLALALFSFIMFMLLLVIFMIHMQGLFTYQYSGFGIDSHGILYVGTDSGIKKYQNGEVIGSVYPQTTRGYSFTVQSDDTLLLSVSDKFITMDLDGNVLNMKDYEDDYHLQSEIEKSNRVFVDQKGSVYKVKLPFLRTTVYDQDGKIVFQMPVLDYVMRILHIFIFIAFFTFIPLFLYKVNGTSKRNQAVIH